MPTIAERPKPKLPGIAGRKFAALLAGECHYCWLTSYELDKHWPFTIPMPGIFIYIDSCVKNSLAMMRAEQLARDLLLPAGVGASGLSVLTAFSWQTYQAVLEAKSGAQVKLWGVPDTIILDIEHQVGYVIDFKTSSKNPAEDPFFPMYRGQLTAYQWIGRFKYPQIKIWKARLAYQQPVPEATGLARVPAPGGKSVASLQDMAMHFRLAPMDVLEYDDAAVDHAIEMAEGLLTGRDLALRKPLCPTCAKIDKFRGIWTDPGRNSLKTDRHYLSEANARKPEPRKPAGGTCAAGS